MENPFLLYNRIKKFIFTGLLVEERKAVGASRFFLKALRVVVISVKEFINGQWPLKASALTFITLVSLIPLLAFILSISKGLGAEKILDREINQYIFKLPGGDLTVSFMRFKKRLLNQIEIMDFTNPSAKGDLLNTVESFDTAIISETENGERELLPKPQTQESNDIATFDELGIFQEQPSDKEQIKSAVEDYKKELFEIINSANFNERDAKEDMATKIESLSLSIPTNISLDAYQYKKQIMGFVDRTSFGYLGAVGLIVLIVTAIRTLGTVEDSFNDIWKVKKSRSIFRKVSDYISMLIIFPILIIASTAVNAALTNEKLLSFLNRIWIGKAYLMVLGWLLPIAVIWIAFIAIYILVPNTKVKLIPGIISGVIGGTIFYLLQYFYFRGQASLAQYNVIYGAFAAVPFFLVWLQLSWTVILFGVQTSFVLQNITAIGSKHRAGGISYASRELLGLILMGRIVSQFLLGKGEKWSDSRLSEELNIPTGLIQEIMLRLSEASLVIEIPVKENTYYIPGRDLDTIYVRDILSVMRNYGESLAPIKMIPYDQEMVRLIDETYTTLKNNLQITIKDIIQKLKTEEKTLPS